jgi:uncharacterized GH25 family protein
MKKSIVAIFTFVLLFSGIAHADLINVISQEYQISGGDKVGFERWSGFLGQGTGLYKWEIALG